MRKIFLLVTFFAWALPSMAQKDSTVKKKDRKGMCCLQTNMGRYRYSPVRLHSFAQG
jgi:hypothetical protein